MAQLQRGDLVEVRHDAQWLCAGDPAQVISHDVASGNVRIELLDSHDGYGLNWVVPLKDLKIVRSQVPITEIDWMGVYNVFKG